MCTTGATLTAPAHTGIAATVGAPFTSTTTLVSTVPKWTPVRVTVAPVLGRLRGLALLMVGGAYASPAGANAPSCPRAVTATRVI